MRRRHVEIKKPIWGGGRPAIGIADFRVLGVDVIDVEILYERADGTRSYPGKYSMPIEKLMKYPKQTVRGGVKLFVAPLGDWEVEYRCPICGSCPMTVDCNNANCDKGQSNG